MTHTLTPEAAQKVVERFKSEMHKAGYHPYSIGFTEAVEALKTALLNASTGEKPDQPVGITHGLRFSIGERAIADCFPRSADRGGIYHLDSGNLQALVHTAIELYDQELKRESVNQESNKGEK